jgi:hypothetical protein
MKRAIIALGFLALLLAGCGPVASPTHYEYDSHAVTTTTTAAAELAQHDNRPVCVGLVILGSCNTSATQTQTAAQPSAAPARAPDASMPTLGDVCRWMLIAAWCSALFCALMAGIRWIYARPEDGTF